MAELDVSADEITELYDTEELDCLAAP